MGELGKKLWALVQEAQGKAFISDSIEERDDDTVIKAAWDTLYWTERTARLLRTFLYDHSKLQSAPGRKRK